MGASKSFNTAFPQGLDYSRNLFIAGGIGLVATAAGYFLDHDQFFFSYLTSFAYFTTIALGALFFVMLQHITRSKWSVVLRRLPETVAANIWPWTIFFIPVLLGMHTLYHHWTNPEVYVEGSDAFDPILFAKKGYLNETFFYIRQAIYFLVWGYLGHRLYKVSTDMDKSGDWGLQTLLRKISAPGILFFALSAAFASFDWLMSLDPHWFSTMFGVYFFAMSFQAFLAFTILLLFFLQGKGILTDVVRIVHIGDVARLLFGFTVFYAYIAFSQFLLIYYANIPEETLWFVHRMENGWGVFTYGLLLGRFVLPFLVLLNKNAKQNPAVLKFITSWILFIHFIELFWIVMPTHAHHPHFSWMDITAFVGLGGIFLGLFFRLYQKTTLFPVNDPFLQESIDKH
jgi:hypothetical protein